MKRMTQKMRFTDTESETGYGGVRRSDRRGL